MAIFDLYHQRKRQAERAGEPEVYVYDQLPQGVRTQLVQIASEAIGPYRDGYSSSTQNNNGVWRAIHKVLCREFAVETLCGSNNPEQEVLHYLKMQPDIDLCLSTIELICMFIQRVMPTKRSVGATADPDEALDEINYRLRQACVGYQYESGHIIRVDSHVMHEQVVKPALRLLADKRFAGAEEEYLTAHKHFRDGNAKDAVTWANNAFESTMKAACDIKGWAYDPGARASDLLKVLRREGLWPDYLDGSFDQLTATLGSGLPKVRNSAGAHGQGAEPKETPMYVAAYALHLAAAKIVLIGEAALGKK